MPNISANGAGGASPCIRILFIISEAICGQYSNLLIGHSHFGLADGILERDEGLVGGPPFPRLDGSVRCEGAEMAEGLCLVWIIQRVAWSPSRVRGQRRYPWKQPQNCSGKEEKSRHKQNHKQVGRMRRLRSRRRRPYRRKTLNTRRIQI